MKINNLKITKKGVALALSGAIALGTLSACGNKQIVDFNKSFNVAVEENNGYVSIVAISDYSDYTGDAVQFATEDGLIVLTSTHRTELIKTNDANAINNYALMIADGNSDRVMDYNKMQGVSIDVSKDNWNKKIFDFVYTYDKAIIFEDDNAIIVELDTWKDYEEDDKIQLKFKKDGICDLRNMDNVKLVNDDNAKEDSLHNYVLSLVGSEENIVYYDTTYTNYVSDNKVKTR